MTLFGDALLYVLVGPYLFVKYNIFKKFAKMQILIKEKEKNTWHKFARMGEILNFV